MCFDPTKDDLNPETEVYWIATGEPEFEIQTWKLGDPLQVNKPLQETLKSIDGTKVTFDGQRYLEIRNALTGRYRHERALYLARREYEKFRKR